MIDGHEFVLNPVASTPTAADGPITIKKPRWMLDRYLELAPGFQGGNVVEVGLWDGGSTAFLTSLLQPRSLVGIELATRELHALDRFLATSPLRDRVHIALGTDQSDRAALLDLLDVHTDGGPLDFVVDDASHLLEPTRATFECLFPRLRPGGMFIIEDWSSDHQMAAALAAGHEAGTLPEDVLAKLTTGRTPDPPLSLLVFDLVMLLGDGTDKIRDIKLRRGWAEIERGPADIDPSAFVLRDLVGALGRSAVPSPSD